MWSVDVVVREELYQGHTTGSVRVVPDGEERVVHVAFLGSLAGVEYGVRSDLQELHGAAELSVLASETQAVSSDASVTEDIRDVVVVGRTGVYLEPEEQGLGGGQFVGPLDVGHPIACQRQLTVEFQHVGSAWSLDEDGDHAEGFCHDFHLSGVARDSGPLDAPLLLLRERQQVCRLAYLQERLGYLAGDDATLVFHRCHKRGARIRFGHGERPEDGSNFWIVLVGYYVEFL